MPDAFQMTFVPDCTSRWELYINKGGGNKSSDIKKIQQFSKTKVKLDKVAVACL